jgi:hypothetical protein
MTSEIIIDDIDVDFPVAGKNNDTQGFRDNFNAISNALSTAASEITVLQNQSAKLNDTNNFSGNLLQNAVTKNIYEHFYNTTGSTVIVTDGAVQKISLTDNILNFTGWPSDVTSVCVFIKIIVDPASENRTLRVTSSNSQHIKTNFDNTVSGGISVPMGKFCILDVWSYDKGQTVFVISQGVV